MENYQVLLEHIVTFQYKQLPVVFSTILQRLDQVGCQCELVSRHSFRFPEPFTSPKRVCIKKNNKFSRAHQNHIATTICFSTRDQVHRIELVRRCFRNTCHSGIEPQKAFHISLILKIRDRYLSSCEVTTITYETELIQPSSSSVAFAQNECDTENKNNKDFGPPTTFSICRSSSRYFENS